MKYQDADKIRKKSFGTLLGEQEGGLGSSLKSALSLKTQAKITGIKETFDPMNLAKAVGGKTGAAIYGKIFGRDHDSMEHFAGIKKRGSISSSSHEVGSSGMEHTSADVLGLIYRLMLRANQEKKNREVDDLEKKKADDRDESNRNDELIKAITGRGKKKPTRKAQAKKKKEEKKTSEVKPKAEKTAPKETPKSPEKVPVKETPKTPAKETSKAPAKETPKTSEKVSPKTPTIVGDGVKSMIKQHEGSVPFPYKDSRGLWTIGIGHLIGDGKSLPSQYEAWKNNGVPYDKKNNKTPAMTPDEINNLFDKDFEEHKKLAMKAPGWEKANETGQAALIDLSYNMGAWWTIFKKASAAMESGDFNKAADQLKYKNPETKELSAWWTQVGPRAVKIVDMIRSGGKESSPGAPKNQALPETLTQMTGKQIDQSSKENKSLKQVASNDTALNSVNNTMNVKQTSGSSPKRPVGDDRNAYLQKAQG